MGPLGPTTPFHPIFLPVTKPSAKRKVSTKKTDSIAKGGKFVLSTGDSKGFATHADYLFGWKGDSLQRAMDHSCMFQACENGKPLKSQAVSAMNNCKIATTVHEDIDAWSKTMPGEKMAM
ncbi:hypothetical protein B0T18DRAFT_394053 [Schizothecium vesticola]|uniref:DUF1996 domain-containing protein n=1 Tax=Schizothecium vesticola TaxID=314040 RepID=A0AA40K0I7_9PEZI|nr:hypothetical protein B0T18DRAFT_394053 [Schizothecium vesticola]